MLRVGLVNLLIIRLLVALIVVSVGIDACAEELVVYSGESFQPQIYLLNGKPAGVIPALFKRLERDTGDQYRLVLLPWKRAINEAGAGHGGITSFSLTEERARSFDYSDPMVDNPIHITVLKERASEFHSLDDLKGKILGIPLGTSFSGEMDRAIADGVYLVDPDSNSISRIKKLLYHRIDAALMGELAIKQSILMDPSLAGLADQFLTLPFPFEHDWEYLAFPKSMHKIEALNRFNRALAALKKSGEYQKIVDDNLVLIQ